MASSCRRLFSETQQSASGVSRSVFHRRAQVRTPTAPRPFARRPAARVGQILVLPPPGCLSRRSERQVSPPDQHPVPWPTQEFRAEFATRFLRGRSPRFSFRSSFGISRVPLRFRRSSPKAQQTWVPTMHRSPCLCPTEPHESPPSPELHFVQLEHRSFEPPLAA